MVEIEIFDKYGENLPIIDFRLESWPDEIFGKFEFTVASLNKFLYIDTPMSDYKFYDINGNIYICDYISCEPEGTIFRGYIQRMGESITINE
jgi:hypothetical protein